MALNLAADSRVELGIGHGAESATSAESVLGMNSEAHAESAAVSIQNRAWESGSES
jgi:hypothetical protein